MERLALNMLIGSRINLTYLPRSYYNQVIRGSGTADPVFYSNNMLSY